MPDGRLLYRLKRRLRDGTTHVIYKPLELMERLAALVPPPRFNIISGSILRNLARLTSTLDMEEADQADANVLNYILREWVRFQGRLNCCQNR